MKFDMTNLKMIFTFIALGLLVSCQPGFDNDKVKTEIEDRFEAFVTDMNTLSVEELRDFYSDDARFYWVEDGQIQYSNKQVLFQSLTGLLQSLKSSNMKMLKLKVEVLDAESAILYAEYEQAMALKSGFTFDINGAMTVLLQKEEGVWRFLTGHSSSKKQRGG